MSYLNYRVELGEEDYQRAYVEVAFLLDAFASTIDNIMGGNTAPVGRIAGRDTAEKLPLYLQGPTLAEVIEVLGRQMAAGFQFSLTGDQLRFEGCIVRQMCAIKKIEPGGALCRLFHHYLDGVANGLLCRPVKSSIVSAGESCTLSCAVQ